MDSKSNSTADVPKYLYVLEKFENDAYVDSEHCDFSTIGIYFDADVAKAAADAGIKAFENQEDGSAYDYVQFIVDRYSWHEPRKTYTFNRFEYYSDTWQTGVHKRIPNDNELIKTMNEKGEE